jgi:hypothetical protein
VEKVDGLDFDFYPESYFPDIFEAYENLNISLAQMIDSVQNDVIVEIDAMNGVLANLLKKDFKKFYSMVENSQNRSLESNLKKIGDEKFKIFSNMAKCGRSFSSILNENDKEAKLSVIFHANNLPLIPFKRKLSNLFYFIVY